MPQIVRSILSVIAGFLVGAIVNMALVILNSFLFMPKGINFFDEAAIKAAIPDLPLAAFFLIILAHAGGTLVGAWVAAKIARRAPVIHGLIIGAIFLVGGIVNLFDFPHPTWFGIVDVILYLPAGWLGGKLASGKRAIA